VPLLIIGSFRPENSRKVFLTALMFGAISSLPLFAVFLISREHKEHVETEPPRLIASLKALVKNPPFLLGLGIFLFTWVSVDLMQTILLYFLKYCLNRERQSDLVMGTVFAAAILALPLWNWLARRWNKRTTYIVGVAFWAAVQLAIISLGPSTPLPLLLALCFLAGVGLGAAHVLPWSILPDAIEWDEWKTGERHEGLFYSAVTLCQKVASSIAIPLALLLLSIFGYRPNEAAQSPAALGVIRLITGPIPAALLGLGILCAILYPLNRRLHARIVAELESRRAAKLDTKV
jgi:Na+/melibiose symporter-like transporter